MQVVQSGAPDPKGPGGADSGGPVLEAWRVTAVGGVGEQSADGHYRSLGRPGAPGHLPASGCGGAAGGGARSAGGDNQVRPEGSLCDRGPKASPRRHCPRCSQGEGSVHLLGTQRVTPDP